MQAVIVSLTLTLAGLAGAQAKQVKDLHPTGSGCDEPMAAMGGRLYFEGSNGSENGELWVTDGTAAGTRNVAVLMPGTGSNNNISSIAALDDRVVFSASSPSTGNELFVSDGTKLGTKLLYEFIVGSSSRLSGVPHNLTRVGDKIYFAARSSSSNFELWVTDGTTVGTKLVKDIHATGNGQPSYIAPIGTAGKFVFAAYSKPFGRELWISDGTTVGTKLLKNVWSEPAGKTYSSNPAYMTELGSKVYFSVQTKIGGGYQIWETDGTTAGTKALLTTRTGRYLTRVGAHIYFESSGSADGSEIWRTDGTVTGTKRVTQIGVGSLGCDPEQLTAVGSRHLYFSAWTLATGREVFKLETAPTIGGTKLTAFREIRSGKSSSSPEALVGGRARFCVNGGMVFFSAFDGSTGTELWMIENGGTAVRLGTSCGATSPALAATDPVLGKTTTFSGTGAPAGADGILLVGAAAKPPDPLLGGCRSYIDPTFMLVVTTWKVTSPSWKFDIVVPSDTSLSGSKVVLQTWFLTPSAVAATNGAHLTVGR